ncbi:hypothetical protein [Kitasatospora sp. NPDC097643]|uniref:TRAFAC clade GTPase domain-containing protein n=1 Tax=Kitasatospora sp. NPDC097643 TaxID=3157230 RepID=UPI0033325672
MARKCVCPHCFRRITHADTRFECATPACRGGEPPVATDPRADRAGCGSCGRVTSRRLCAHCGDLLPSGYLEQPGTLVALVGPPNSGKSTYIGVLVHELRHGVGKELDAALQPCDDNTVIQYEEGYGRVLFDEHRTVRKTDTRLNRHSVAGRPLVYQLKRRRRGLFGQKHATLTLVFLDAAGEHYGSDDQVEREARYLAEADALVLLLDPQDLPGTAGPAGPGRAVSGGASTDVLSRVLRHLTAVHDVKPNRKLRLPIAVAITKLDLLLTGIEDNSPLRRERPAGARFDADDREAVHTELRARLDQWQADGVSRELDHYCADYQLFGISMLGTAPRGEAIDPGGIRPHRIEDPLIWLLHKFGMLDRGKG